MGCSATCFLQTYGAYPQNGHDSLTLLLDSFHLFFASKHVIPQFFCTFAQK